MQINYKYSYDILLSQKKKLRLIGQFNKINKLKELVDKKFKPILKYFPIFNDLSDCKARYLYYNILSIIQNGNYYDFEKLRLFNFHGILMQHIMGNTKPIIFQYCADILNNFFVNTQAHILLEPFLNLQFANYIFFLITYNCYQNNDTHIQNSMVNPNLLQLFKNLILNYDELIFSLPQFFETICNFFFINDQLNPKSASFSLDIISYILSNEEISKKLDITMIHPITNLIHQYLNMLNHFIQENHEQIQRYCEYEYIYTSFSPKQFHHFSSICNLIILLIQAKLPNINSSDYSNYSNELYESIELVNLFPVLGISNLKCAEALMNLINFVMLFNDPTYYLYQHIKQLISLIDWNYIDKMIYIFNALTTNKVSLMLKICRFAENIIFLRMDNDDIAIDHLFHFLDEGAFLIRQESLKIICNFFILYHEENMKRGFLDSYYDCFIPSSMNNLFMSSIISIAESADDECLKNILTAVWKILDGYQFLNSRNPKSQDHEETIYKNDIIQQIINQDFIDMLNNFIFQKFDTEVLDLSKNILLIIHEFK